MYLETSGKPVRYQVTGKGFYIMKGKVVLIKKVTILFIEFCEIAPKCLCIFTALLMRMFAFRFRKPEVMHIATQGVFKCDDKNT